MTQTDAKIAYGATFGIESGTPDTYDTVAGIVGIVPPGISRGEIDATHMASPDRFREFIPGLFTQEPCTFRMQFSSARYVTLQTAALATNGGKYKITLNDTSTLIGEGFVTQLTPPDLSDVEGLKECNVTIRPKGKWTFADNT